MIIDSMSVLLQLKIYRNIRGGWISCNRLDHARWDTSHYRMGGYVPGDHCTSGHYSATANMDSVGYDCSGAYPDIIFYSNSLGSDALLYKGTGRVSKYVVDGSQLHER